VPVVGLRIAFKTIKFINYFEQLLFLKNNVL